MHHCIMYTYINFQQNWFSRSVKTVHTSLQKSSNYINLHLSSKILKKSRLSDMHYPLTDIKANLEINRPVRYRNTTKKKLFPQTTDGRTDGQTSRKTTIGSFFRKKKKLLKNGNLKKLRQYLIKIYSKTHQIAPFKKDNYRESMPRTPLTKCMVSKSEKIKKINYWAPPCQILANPCYKWSFWMRRKCVRRVKKH